jgi:ribulose-5-phosphate 4-epimerase/fuculose-1-phosphate aldolase
MDDFGGLALDEDEGDRLARALGEKRILFLANHGVIVVGPSVANAFNDLYYLEKACMAQITAMSSGRSLKRIPQEVAEYTYTQMQGDRDDQSSRHFMEIRRILDKEEPDYAT